MSQSYCERCHHTGLLPFILPNGAISQYAKVFCECREQREQHNYLPPLRPEDFDFSMSADFRALTYQYCGVPDPGYVPPQPQPALERVIVHRTSDMSKQDWDLLQQTARRVEFLEKKLAEKKKPSKYQRYIVDNPSK